jgi:hypothetical protein
MKQIAYSGRITRAGCRMCWRPCITRLEPQATQQQQQQLVVLVVIFVWAGRRNSLRTCFLSAAVAGRAAEM